MPGGMWATPAYFNNTVYYGPVGNPMQAFTIANGKLSTIATANTSYTLDFQVQHQVCLRMAPEMGLYGP